MGKANFIDVRDATDRMQVYIRMNDVGEEKFADDDFAYAHTEKVLNVLHNMIAQIDKQAARPKSKTSARATNEKLAVMFIAAIRAADKPVNAKWIAEHVNGTLTPQRGVHVAKIALEWGAIQEVEIKKRKFYEFVPDWQGCAEFAEVARKMR